MASNNLLEKSVCVSSNPLLRGSEEESRHRDYIRRCEMANQIISSAFKSTGLSKDEIQTLVTSQPTLWIRLNDDYPISMITEGIKKAYNGLREHLGRNPGIREILHCIDPNISPEKYW